MIKELKDVLVLVGQLPADWQMECVRRLSWEVEKWEDRIQEPNLTDAEYDILWNQRYDRSWREQGRKKRGW